MRYFLFILVLLSSSLYSTAQTRDHHGCHHTRNKAPKPKALTDAEKILVQNSIARSDTFDIIHYDINLDVTNYSGQEIKGFTRVSYSPKFNDLDAINLDLFELQIDSIIDDSGSIEYSYDDEIIHVEFSSSPSVGDTLDLTVYYHGQPHKDPYWGGFYFIGDYIYNLGIGLTSIPPNFGKVWYPCFDSFVERATYEYHIISNDGRKAFCQGTFMGEEIIAGDTLLRHYEFNQKIPTYLSAIAVSNYEMFEYTHEGANGSIPVSLTAKPAHLSSMQNAFNYLSFAIDACEYWYGPYIWDRVGYVLTTDGALEIPTNVAYPQSMLGANQLENARLFTHELGHHWWGDVVTLKEHHDMWIKEGPAEYSAHLFREWKDGEEAFIEEMKDNQLFVLEEAHVQDDTFQALSPMPDEHIYGRHTYNKGAAVIHNLRGYLGDDTFRDAMHYVQSEYAYTSFSANELREVLEEASGADLESFFNDWIFSPGFTTFVVDSFSTVNVGDNFETTIYLQQKLRENPNFHTNVPIEIAALNSNWEQEIFTAEVGNEFSEVVITTSYQPEMIVYDPNYKFNDGRMDHNQVLYPDESFGQQLPFVDFRLIKDEVLDSCLVRIEHIYSGPDDENLSDAIFEISSTHYWIVDGIWPEGTSLEGKLFFNGTEDTYLDYDLTGITESDIMLVYRETSDDEWQVYDDYSLLGGSDNGSGLIEIDVLRKGQYAFANGDPLLRVNENGQQDSEYTLFPNPTQDLLNISGIDVERGHQVMVYDLKGKLSKELAIEGGQIDVQGLANGFYILSVLDENNTEVFSASFEVAK